MLFFRLCKWSKFSFLHSTKIYVFYTNSLEFLDLFAKCFDHASNLSILPLLEDDAELSWCDALHDTRSCHNIPKIDTSREFVYFVVFNRTKYLYKILFFMRKAWMHQPVSHATIIGEEDKTSCFFIQSTNRKDASWKINNIHNTRLTTRYTGRYNITRLIKSIIYIWELLLDNTIIKLNSIYFWINHLSNVSFYPIYADAPLFDEFFSMPTRCYSLLGEIFLKFHIEKER